MYLRQKLNNEFDNMCMRLIILLLDFYGSFLFDLFAIISFGDLEVII